MPHGSLLPSFVSNGAQPLSRLPACRRQQHPPRPYSVGSERRNSGFRQLFPSPIRDESRRIALLPRARRRSRRLAAACAFAWTLVSVDASALFIVNQPWVSPASKGQTTRAYMNLTSTEGATLLGARSEDAAEHVAPIRA